MKPLLFLLFSFLSWQSSPQEYFFPAHRVSGVGVERDDLSGAAIQARTDMMIESQTFGIMREPEALAGARRVTDPKLQSIIKSASASSGFPASMLEAIIFLESWGDPKAESPTGPKGIMQISEATARDMGLKVVRATKYKITREKVAVATKSKKPKYRIVTHKEPYTVTLRDDRLNPGRAIPAAAQYLQNNQRKFGGQDWAIFSYHCGAGCVSSMLDLTSRARGIPRDELTVPRMFFSCSPSWNRDLYQAIQQQMSRDYSPTYYFRIQRAEQLLNLYRRDPSAFASLQQDYKNQFASGPRAPHRLSAWLKRDDLIYHTSDDIRTNAGDRLVKAPLNADYLGYSLELSNQDAPEASPAAIGALTYVAFETRRLYRELNGLEIPFQPLRVTALVESEDLARQSDQREALSHSSGQVFDLDATTMPAQERECLRFVLDDLGWSGYLGFVEDGTDHWHIGCSPSSREFFASVLQEVEGRLPAVEVTRR